MTNEDIVQRLRAFRPTYGWPEEQATVVKKSLGDEAADLIEAQAAEIERMKASQQMMIETSLALGQQNKVMEKALIRLRDCDWVITLPDRMDAVREIARKALEQ